MPERTQLSQPDEALRRAVPSDDARDVLRQIADRLTDVRPAGPMNEATRHALALRYSSAEYGVGAGTAELEHEVLRHMPAVRRGQTRGEYALVLRKTAQA